MTGSSARVLVLGATGKTGSRVVDALRRRSVAIEVVGSAYGLRRAHYVATDGAAEDLTVIAAANPLRSLDGDAAFVAAS